MSQERRLYFLYLLGVDGWSLGSLRCLRERAEFHTLYFIRLKWYLNTCLDEKTRLELLINKHVANLTDATTNMSASFRTSRRTRTLKPCQTPQMSHQLLVS